MTPALGFLAAVTIIGETVLFSPYTPGQTYQGLSQRTMRDSFTCVLSEPSEVPKASFTWRVNGKKLLLTTLRDGAQAPCVAWHAYYQGACVVMTGKVTGTKFAGCMLIRTTHRGKGDSLQVLRGTWRQY